jgi:hypothetical protein
MAEPDEYEDKPPRVLYGRPADTPTGTRRMASGGGVDVGPSEFRLLHFAAWRITFLPGVTLSVFRVL